MGTALQAGKVAVDLLIFLVGLLVFVEKVFPAIKDWRLTQYVDQAILSAKKLLTNLSDQELLKTELDMVEAWCITAGYEFDSEQVTTMIHAAVARLKETLQSYDKN